MTNKFDRLFNLSFIPIYLLCYLLFIESFKSTNKFLWVLSIFSFWAYNFYMFSKYKINGLKILILIIILYIKRATSYVTFDDLHPLNMNITPQIFLDKSKYLFVIPKLKNESILKYPKWIEKIKKYANNNNKILALHGVSHDVENGPMGLCEFSYKKSEEYIKEGVDIFIKAFGFKPKYFKAPCYGLHPDNKKIIEDYGIQVVGPESKIFSKLFHPDNSSWMYFINRFTLIF